MEKLKLTVNFIKKLVPGQNARYADSEVPGLQVRVGASSVAYYLRKRQGQKVHEIALGRHPDITLEEARQKALEKLGALANYQEIEAPSARRQPLLKDAVNMLLEEVANPRNVTSVMQRWQFLYDRKITEITPEDIKTVFDGMADTPSSANHAVRYLKSALGKISRHFQIPNPAPLLFSGIKPYPEKPRMRFIKEKEAPEFIEALQTLRDNVIYSAQADALLVMLYTGQRKSRVLHMTGEQINADTQEWYVPGNNIKRPVTHPFNQEAWEIVSARLKTYGNGFLFQWRGKPLDDCRKTIKKAMEMCGIENLHIHDLRRSLGSWMLSSGASIESVSKTLGHSSIRVTEQVYAHILNSKGREDTSAAIAAMKKGKVE